MGLVRRLRPGRFSSIETAELLKRVLGGPVEAASAAAMHVQSEGVPFIVEELARTHRDAGTLQQIDGEWRLGRNAARLVPSAVRTLIDRRAARLPARTPAALGDAAILGRSFSLRDLRAIRARVGDGATSGDGVREPQLRRTSWQARRRCGSAGGRPRPRRPCGPPADAGAGRAGGLHVHPRTGPPVRGEPAVLGTTPAGPRRRRRPAAGGRRPGPAGLPMLAQHALAAGDTVRAARFSIDAATAALASNAPEEALRLVEQALPVVSTPADRRVLLSTRDDAFAVLRQTAERLNGLTELAALAEAMRDPKVELDVQLRRASALRRATTRMRRRSSPAASAPEPPSRATPRQSFGRRSSSARRSCAARSASRSAAPRSRPTSTAPRRRTAPRSRSPSSCTTTGASPRPFVRSG